MKISTCTYFCLSSLYDSPSYCRFILICLLSPDGEGAQPGFESALATSTANPVPTSTTPPNPANSTSQPPPWPSQQEADSVNTFPPSTTTGQLQQQAQPHQYSSFPSHQYANQADTPSADGTQLPHDAMVEGNYPQSSYHQQQSHVDQGVGSRGQGSGLILSQQNQSVPSQQNLDFSAPENLQAQVQQQQIAQESIRFVEQNYFQ